MRIIWLLGISKYLYIELILNDFRILYAAHFDGGFWIIFPDYFYDILFIFRKTLFADNYFLCHQACASFSIKHTKGSTQTNDGKTIFYDCPNNRLNGRSSKQTIICWGIVSGNWNSSLILPILEFSKNVQLSWYSSNAIYLTFILDERCNKSPHSSHHHHLNNFFNSRSCSVYTPTFLCGVSSNPKVLANRIFSRTWRQYWGIKSKFITKVWKPVSPFNN